MTQHLYPVTVTPEDHPPRALNWRERLGLAKPTAFNNDVWHHRADPPDFGGAGNYPFDVYGAVFFSPVGAGDVNRQQYYYAVPNVWAPFTGAGYGLGGVQMGAPGLTALLMSQVDATARGLATAPQTGSV